MCGVSSLRARGFPVVGSGKKVGRYALGSAPPRLESAVSFRAVSNIEVITDAGIRHWMYAEVDATSVILRSGKNATAIGGRHLPHGAACLFCGGEKHLMQFVQIAICRSLSNRC